VIEAWETYLVYHKCVHTLENNSDLSMEAPVDDRWERLTPWEHRAGSKVREVLRVHLGLWQRNNAEGCHGEHSRWPIIACLVGNVVLRS
jgi:hypothetical protein